MSTKTSFTYSYNNTDDVSISKVIEYKTSYTDDNDNTCATSYKNNIEDDKMHESFNKLVINKQESSEQIGVSINKDDWKLQEFHNDDLLKEYKEDYDKHPYYKYYLEDKLHNIVGNNDTVIDNFKNGIIENNIPQLTL